MNDDRKWGDINKDRMFNVSDIDRKMSDINDECKLGDIKRGFECNAITILAISRVLLTTTGSWMT